MYDWKAKRWKAECEDETLIRWCRESYNQENAEAQFLLADSMLAEAESGRRNADAVWLMQKAANAGNVQALYAMGQMFHSGWGVHKDKKAAVAWYEKAAAAGSMQAREALLGIRRSRRRLIGGIGISVAAVLAAAVILVIVFDRLKGFRGNSQSGEQSRAEVLVGENTELRETVTFEEFEEEVRRILEEYDDELVVSGKRSTNRLILKFEGTTLDLTNFLAERVIARENNMVVIQFCSEEEAERCLEALRKNKSVLYVETDEYSIGIQDTMQGESAGEDEAAYPEVFFNGYSYNSWGASDLELDQLAEWLAPLTRQRSVTVAVMDTGVQPNTETKDRILEGIDVVIGGNGWTDYDGHGTHVSGIILDCTQGLEVYIYCRSAYLGYMTRSLPWHTVQGLNMQSVRRRM